MKLYKIFLPKKYNDGKEIEIQRIQKIAENVKDKFGAYSLNPDTRPPIIQGVWTSQKTNETYSEPMFLIELFIEDTFDNQKWLKSFKELIRQELKQDELFIISQDAELVTY